ncbi:MAG: type II secretion system protein M [Deltaproteobacteria bacterium]|nr:type II secretion system protein M [Deltaproteobacteria bacterium]
MIKRLNPRERWIVIAGLVLLGILSFWYLLLNPYFETMGTLDRRIAADRRNLTRVSQMSEQIIRLRQQLAGADLHNLGGKPLFIQVENLTEQAGVREQLLAMRPQPVTTQGEFRQQLVEIRLEKLSLAQLVKLLHAIEYRSGGVQIKSLRVKPRFENRSELDVNMVLMSLEKP